MRLRVSVTAEDIRLGKRNDCDRCPAARALRRAGITRGWVGNYWIGETVGGLGMSLCDSPIKVRKFIRAFDSFGRKKVKPFSFTINVPREAVRK